MGGAFKKDKQNPAENKPVMRPPCQNN